MLADRVKCAVPNPLTVGVGSTVTLGAAPSGFRSFLSAFGAAQPSYFILSDGAGRAITGVWTNNAGSPETATITEILGNDRLGGTSGETFAGACTAWNAMPAREFPLLRSGPLAGLRNLVINGNPTINQRSYASGTATTVANQYTLDRWRVVTLGQALSWADSGGIRTVTFPAGGGEQVIEGGSILPGVYTLSWVGTAVALINGAAVANAGQITLAGNTNAILRFSSGTASLIQLEPGPLKSPFEFRPIGIETALCERYFWRLTAAFGMSGVMVSGIGAGYFFTIPYPTTMRATPTLTNLSYSANFNVNSANFSYNCPQYVIAYMIASGSANGGVSIQLDTAWFNAEL